jgi:hypothetical protein
MNFGKSQPVCIVRRMDILGSLLALIYLQKRRK